MNGRPPKGLLAIEDGVREPTESWRRVLRDLKRKGMKIWPKLALGESAFRFWTAVEEQFPETRNQRCWLHKTGNALNYLPKANSNLQETKMIESRGYAEVIFDRSVAMFKAKYPRATECPTED